MTCIDKTANMNYIEASNYLERMSKRYKQTQCTKCNLWHIWKKKDPTGL